MALPLKPRLLKRYRDIALLLVRYRPLASDAEADPADATRFATDLERLGPTFIKLGQLLSTRADLLPPPYLDALSRLQDQVEPFDFAEVEKTFQAEVGVRMSKAFAEVDQVPVAAASLAQVHRAVLREGRVVAIKVQRPDLPRRVHEDLEVLGDIADFADGHSDSVRRLQLRAMFEEFKRSLLRELDFQNEARNLVVLGANLAEFEHLIVPQPVADFTTSRVLTLDFVKGRKITRLGPLAALEMDGHELADELFRAYLKQILVDGFFHADPHPGNVLMTADHRLALIDLGMTAQVAPRTQENLLQLLMALAEGRSEEAARLGVLMGERTEYFDEAAYRRRVAELVGDTQDATLRNLEVGRTILQVSRVSTGTGLQLPVELTLLGKTLLNLDQVAAVLDPDFNPNEAIRRHAPELMQQRLSRDLSPGNVFSSLVDVRDFVQQMPRRVNRILDAVAENELEIKVHAIDETRLMSGLHKIANRITMGLVLSALIVGAALLMRVETPIRILGYPALAIVCFSLAFGGGLLLLWAIIQDERKAGRRD
ncbi:MAG TPA: AarF/UbiB family protein [Candidatus Dormibacteraeota bacterium]